MRELKNPTNTYGVLDEGFDRTGSEVMESTKNVLR